MVGFCAQSAVAIRLSCFLKYTLFRAQADMLDQEAAFVQIQEAKTMVEEDLQRRLEEFEEEKEQLQKMAASAAALEQQLEQASTCHGLSQGPGPHTLASCGCPRHEH